MDVQDIQDGNFSYGTLTRATIGCSFDVANELGAGFLESVYEKALSIALIDAGLSAESQRSIHVNFRSKIVGDFYADLLVEEKVLIELKTVKAILPEHHAQIINYLNATGITVGLLINFANPKLEYKRLTRGPKPLS